MDIGLIATVIGTGIAIIGTLIAMIAFNYQIMRNFKDDVSKQIEANSKQIESNHKKTEKLDERIFHVLSGKSLKEAILEEKMKEKQKDENGNI